MNFSFFFFKCKMQVVPFCSNSLSFPEVLLRSSRNVWIKKKIQDGALQLSECDHIKKCGVFMYMWLRCHSQHLDPTVDVPTSWNLEKDELCKQLTAVSEWKADLFGEVEGYEYTTFIRGGPPCVGILFVFLRLWQATKEANLLGLFAQPLSLINTSLIYCFLNYFYSAFIIFITNSTEHT